LEKTIMVGKHIKSLTFDAPFVRIRGRISRRDEVRFSPCVRTLHPGRADSRVGTKRKAKTEPRHLPLPYRVTIEDGGGKILESEYFAIKFRASTREWTRFVARLPYRAAAKRVVVYFGERELGSLSFPAHAPTFVLLHPTIAHSIDPNSCLELDWKPEGKSAGESLVYFVRYSTDGKRWSRPAVNLTSTRVCVDLRLMEGGASCRLQVLATNGYHTSYVETPNFAVPEKPTRVLLGDMRGPTLFAQGFSHKHGPLVGEAIVWSANGKEVARGGSFDVRRLRYGGRQIAVAVSAPDGTTSRIVLGPYDCRTGFAMPPPFGR
jgi:hypothetical protein